MQNTSCKGKSEVTVSHFALSEYSEETEAENTHSIYYLYQELFTFHGTT